ncbi:MAG TPA: hypothetical protein VMB19_08955 [Silvibacterium sp.]|nr:hypothetical protein [Silvibacterium sp.]
MTAFQEYVTQQLIPYLAPYWNCTQLVAGFYTPLLLILTCRAEDRRGLLLTHGDQQTLKTCVRPVGVWVRDEVAIHVEYLVASFHAGLVAYLGALIYSADRAKAVESRADIWFAPLGQHVMKDFLNLPSSAETNG